MSSSTARRTWAPSASVISSAAATDSLEQRRQALGRVAADDVLAADQGEEGVAGARFLDPGQRVDDAGGGHRAFAVRRPGPTSGRR